MAKTTPMQPNPRKRERDPLLISVKAVTAPHSKTGMMRRAYVFDLTALRDGREKSKRGPAFSGRPHLAARIGAAIQKYTEDHSPPTDTLKALQGACFHLWVFLDDDQKRNPGRGRINAIGQLQGDIWTSFCFALARLNQNNAHSIYSRITMILRRAEPDVYFPGQPFSQTPIPARRESTDPYPLETAKSIEEALRKDRYALLARFEKANAVADQGDPPTETLQRHHRKSESFGEVWTPANILRFVRDELLPSLPDREIIRRRYGISTFHIGMAPDAPVPVPVQGQPIRTRSSANCAGLIGLYRHFLPSYRDLVPLAAEAIAVEGLNPQCVMDYNRDESVRESADPDFLALYSCKSRALGKSIETISSKGPDSLSDIITTAIRITEPLRKTIDRELARLRAGDEPGAKRIHHLEFLRNRVWLTLKAKDVGVGWLRQDIDFRLAVNEVLTRHCVKENGVQVRWDSRRFRDRKAKSVFDMEKSLEQVRVALNHSCMNMPELYVTTPERTQSDNQFLRRRFEKLDALQDWPKLPLQPTHTGSSIEFIVTAQGRKWLASRCAVNPAIKEILP